MASAGVCSGEFCMLRPAKRLARAVSPPPGAASAASAATAGAMKDCEVVSESLEPSLQLSMGVSPAPLSPSSVSTSSAASLSLSSGANSAASMMSTGSAMDFVLSPVFLPDEIVSLIFECMDVPDLLRLSAVCTRFRDIASCDTNWKSLFVKRWGGTTKLMDRAAALAGGWKHLYLSKQCAEKASSPWTTPSEFEVQAIVESMQDCTQTSTAGSREVVIVFLVDGSGSVTEDDFSTMTNFMSTAVDSIKRAHPEAKIGIVQFSNEVRIELAPTNMSKEEFHTMVKGMVRMNGGTNIAASIKKAEALLTEGIAVDAHRVVALLTDGRVDSMQAREAVQQAEGLANAVANVSLYAFGVGRGVDKLELTRIVAAMDGTKDGEDSSRYLALRTQDENAW